MVMASIVGILAILLGIVLLIAALITLAMEMYVVSGTFFTFVAFMIYLRETRL